MLTGNWCSIWPVTIMARLTIPAYSFGGALPRVAGGVVHDAETPMKAGYAQSICGWFSTPAPGDSAHGMVDSRDIVQMLPWNVTAWHVGPNANGTTIGIEQAGYASQSREEWLTPDGLAQMDNLITFMREGSAVWNIPLRLELDPAVVRNAILNGGQYGWCYHDTISKAVGGTGHTDPTPNYPTDILAQRLAGQIEPQPVIPVDPWEEFMASIAPFTLFAFENATCIANRFAGTWFRFAGAADYQARVNALTRSGIPIDNWGTLDGHPIWSYFGQEVSQFDNDPRVGKIQAKVGA